MLTLAFFTAFSQKVPVNIINKTEEIKLEVYYIRAYKSDVLKINIQTELKNEKKGKYYDVKNVKLYRQDAKDDFQYIVDKENISKLDVEVVVPSDGIYTLIVDRGGMKNFNTTLFVQRLAENDSMATLNKKAIYVNVPDTVHTYTQGAEVYDHIRTATPYTKKQFMPQYKEDQIFMDVSYALRIDNKYAIPIQIPYEIMTDYKISKSIKWGFMVSVSDEVYKALQGKVAELATEAIGAGVGKACSGKVNSETGEVLGNSVTKGYAIFDNASTVNAVAGISGDVGESAGSESTTVASDVVKTMTAFTGLTELAGETIGGWVPRIEDEIKYEVLSQKEYRKMLNKEPYTTMQKGHGCFVSGEFDIKNANDIYYLVIENERSTGGGFWDVAESIGKTMLSQYVYANVKVFVQRKVEVMYQKGYYENTFKEVTNPTWSHTQDPTIKKQVIFETENKPYYQQLNSPTIY